jgi:H+/Cl- antiporter ClcA
MNSNDHEFDGATKIASVFLSAIATGFTLYIIALLVDGYEARHGVKLVSSKAIGWILAIGIFGGAYGYYFLFKKILYRIKRSSK